MIHGMRTVSVLVALISFLFLAAGSGAQAAPPASLSTGAYHTCAVASFDNFVRCWGWNASYQAGLRAFEDSHDNRLTPDTVNLFSGTGWMGYADLKAQMVAGGRNHTCAIGHGDQVYCWGSNEYGQSGTLAMPWKDHPELVPLPAGYYAEKIVAGRYHSCALVINDMYWGEVMCWGQNNYGQLGDNTTVDSATPVLVTGLGAVADIAAGGAHTCALLEDGTVKCWGYNRQGQLGTGTTTNSAIPVEVMLNASTPLSGVSSIATGGTHSCSVLASDGRVMCWGNNTMGQLGNGTLTGSGYPIEVTSLDGTAPSPLSGAVSVTGGWGHGCALLQTGRTKCWGDNTSGQVGDGTKTRRTHAVEVALPEARAVSAGDRHTCAILNFGGLRCWGYGGVGQLGTGGTADSSTPVTVQY